jgi:anaerobic selenocysteine-containing dehydrogenase
MVSNPDGAGKPSILTGSYERVVPIGGSVLAAVDRPRRSRQRSDPMTETRYATCPLCEAICGIAVEVDGDRIVKIRGDEADPFSRGYVCPKAVGLMDIQHDPDRIRAPMRREGTSWREIGWDEALDTAARRIVEIQARHGKDAVAFYFGNPTGHSYAAILFGLFFVPWLGSKNVFSSNSVDALPRLLVSALLYGNQAVLPVPDLDRTDFLLVLGANPAVSNGSVMTAPDVGRRLKRLRERGGRLVVVDPRRTETAALADTHLFIRPGTDALLLAALVRTVLFEGLSAPGRLGRMTDGLGEVRTAVERFTPEAVSPAVGIEAAAIRTLAREFAAAKSAVAYGRMGTCVQEHGALASWLVDVLNIVTGNLDREGGAMFPSPAVDLAALAGRTGQAGKRGRWKSRVRGLDEFNYELPVATFAEEIDTPGEGQIRGLITHAGNPVLSIPNGRRLDRALAGLEFMVSIDIYRNETTRHADLILPPSFGLEHDHYPLIFHAVAVRNTARYALPVVQKPPGVRHDWEIFLGLMTRFGKGRGGAYAAAALAQEAVLSRVGSKGLLRVLLGLGGRLSLQELERAPHGIDLGPLEPRLPGALHTPRKRIQLAPPLLTAGLAKLADDLAKAPEVPRGELMLIGRRTLRSNNSWMHNSQRLVKGPVRCTLLMHPRDAAARGLSGGQSVRITSDKGAVEAPLEVSDEVMPGVVSLPHGWGHDRSDARLSVAAAHAGVSINDLTDERRIDAISGASSLNGVPVSVAAAAPRESARALSAS